MTRSISLLFIKSNTFGFFLLKGQFNIVDLIPYLFKKLNVPSVVNNLKLFLWSILMKFNSSALIWIGPVDRRIFFFGIEYPTEINDFKNASLRSFPRHATSPVDAIST